MKNKILYGIVTALSFIGLLLVVSKSSTNSAYAQEAKTQTMPEVIVLGKDAKLGQVTFSHKKHNGGEYNITPGTPISCDSCHHTAAPAEVIANRAPLKTSWPADRTTTLTLDLFTKDPKVAGVAACRDCHARAGEKPKLIDSIPELKHEGSTALISVNNQNAFHRNCAGCHAEVKKAVPATKAPGPNQCTVCHKKAS